SGLEFCQELLSEETKPPRLILATNYHAKDMIEQARQIGVAEYIVKPYTSSALLRVLCSALAISEQTSVTARPTRLEEICSAPVLLVEDNDINQMIAKEMLQQAGLIVDVARNGEEAVTMVKAKSYALVFMDIQMPVM